VTGPLRASSTGLPAELPLTVVVDGVEIEIPDLPARVWVDALTHEPPGCWWKLIPEQLHDTDADLLIQRVLDSADAFDLDDLEDLAVEVLTAVLGCDLWAARRLVLSAWSNWLHFDGWCVTRGLDSLLTGHPARIVSAAWAWRLSMCQKKSEVTALESEVWSPDRPDRASGRPRDAAPEGWDDQAEGGAFLAAMGQLGSSRRRQAQQAALADQEPAEVR
jgi:hypothetical protein